MSPALLYMPCAGLSGMSKVQVFLTPMHLAIAMEYAKGGNLFHYLLQHGPHCRLTEAKAQWIFQQLIIGLDYCHRRVSACQLDWPIVHSPKLAGCMSSRPRQDRYSAWYSISMHLIVTPASHRSHRRRHLRICSTAEC